MFHTKRDICLKVVFAQAVPASSIFITHAHRIYTDLHLVFLHVVQLLFLLLFLLPKLICLPSLPWVCFEFEFGLTSLLLCGPPVLLPPLLPLDENVGRRPARFRFPMLFRFTS
jgi:hypothetical protein